MEACDDAETSAPVTRLVCDQFELARQEYVGDSGELHVVNLEEDTASVSLSLDSDWAPHWER